MVAVARALVDFFRARLRTTHEEAAAPAQPDGNLADVPSERSSRRRTGVTL